MKVNGLTLTPADLQHMKGEATTVAMSRDEARALIDQVEDADLMTALDTAQAEAETAPQWLVIKIG